MKELEAQQKWGKYPGKCRKEGHHNIMRRDEEYVGKRMMWRGVEGKEDGSGSGWTVLDM